MLGLCPLTYRALSQEKDEFEEWAKPLVALSAEAERILGVTNSQLECCRSTDKVMQSLIAFAEI